MNDKQILEVDEDGVITFPDELLAVLGWKEGDELDFILQADNTVLLTRAKNATTEVNQGALDP